MSRPNKKWMKLDNAAKVYPAARSRSWMAMFRLSAQLRESVDPEILRQALVKTLHRFPSFSQKLESGLFWNYLEHIDGIPEIQPDVQNPCVLMNFNENQGFMFRVRYHDRRIAVEFFHVLTDGTGGLCFLKTLVAEYLTLFYGVSIPRSKDILDCGESPSADELEDGYLKFAGRISRSRREPAAFCIPGTPVSHFMYITTGFMDVEELLKLSRSYHATLTEFITAVLILSIDKVQLKLNPNQKKHKPVKICIPINLRKYYDTNTMRNFALYMNPGIEPKYGRYTLQETIKIVRGYMAVESDEKLLNARFSTNVMSEQNLLLRIVPLYLKSKAIRLIFLYKGDRQTSSTVSNLGAVNLPAEMAQYVDRMDFMLGPLSRNRVACGCLSYGGKLMVNFTRKIEESYIEHNFFTSLVKLGVHVTVESNQRR